MKQLTAALVGFALTFVAVVFLAPGDVEAAPTISSCSYGQSCTAAKFSSTSTAGPDFTCAASSGNKCLSVTNDGARVYVGATAYLSAAAGVISGSTSFSSTAYNVTGPTTNGYQLGGVVSLYNNTGTPGNSAVVNGRATTSATAQGVALTNNTTLSTAGSQAVAFYAGNLGSTQIGAIDYQGGLFQVGVTWANLQACAAATLGTTNYVTDIKARFFCDGLRWIEAGPGRYLNAGPLTEQVLTSGVNPTLAPVYYPGHKIADATVTYSCALAGAGALSSGSTTKAILKATTGALAADDVYCSDSAAWVLSSEAVVEWPVYAADTYTTVSQWHALAASEPTTTTLPANGMGFRANSVAGDTNWQFCTTDATPTQSCTDTGVPVTAGQYTLLSLDTRTLTASTGIAWQVASGATTAKGLKTTNLPTATLELVVSRLEATAAAARYMQLGPATIKRGHY